MGAAGIERWMPGYEVREMHRRDIEAPVATVDAAVRSVDLAGSLPVRLLFLARGLLHPLRRSFTLADFVALGFTLLEDTPGEEVVLGLTGRFWHPSGALLRLTPEEFGAFERPGFVQAGWDFRLDSRGHGCALTTETRVRATDEGARRAFARYWGVVRPFSGLVRRRMLARVAAEAERRPGAVGT